MTDALDTRTLGACIRLNQEDNVAVCTHRLEAGTQASGVMLRDDIPRGHKFAITAIAEGEPVLKYAQIIGYASQSMTSNSSLWGKDMRRLTAKPTFRPERRLGSDTHQPHCQTASPGSPGQTASAGSG